MEKHIQQTDTASTKVNSASSEYPEICSKFLEISPVALGIFESTEKGEVKFINPRFVKLFGRHSTEVECLTDFMRESLVDGSSWEKFKLWWRDIATPPISKKTPPRRWIMATESHHRREVAVFCFPGPNQILALFVDMTPHRRRLRERRGSVKKIQQIESSVQKLENEITEQRKQIEGTLDALVDPHMIIAPVYNADHLAVDWTVDHSNTAAANYWRVGPRESIGKRVREFIAPHHAPLVMSWCRDVLSTGEPLIINDYAYGVDPMGTERRFDIRISRVDGFLSVTWRDVTERHRVAQKTAESEERYRLLALNVSDVVVLTDKDKIVRWVSPSITPLLGWDFRDWIGRPCTDFLASKEEAREFERHRTTVFREGHSEICRKQILSKDGSSHWVEANTGPHISVDGKTDGVVTSFRLVDRQVSMENALLRMTRIDELTKLLNRREGLAQLEKIHEQTQRTGSSMAVLFVDFDDFKSINDRYGHSTGDDVLRAMGERVHSCLRTSDDVGARIGGDEMLVVLHGIRGLPDARSIAEKLRRAAEAPILSQGNLIRITVSIGVAISQPAERPEDLVSRADDAMYQAKIKGRNQVVVIPSKEVLPSFPPLSIL